MQLLRLLRFPETEYGLANYGKCLPVSDDFSAFINNPSMNHYMYGKETSSRVRKSQAHYWSERVPWGLVIWPQLTFSLQMPYKGLWFLSEKATSHPIASIQERSQSRLVLVPSCFGDWIWTGIRVSNLVEGRLDIGTSGSCRFKRIWHIIMVRSFYPIFSAIGMSAFLVSDGIE